MDQGLSLAFDLGFKHVILESDCFEGAKVISKTAQIHFHRVLSIVTNVRTWLAHDSVVEIGDSTNTSGWVSVHSNGIYITIPTKL
ncbi:hypothetical protein Lal_00013302 [Lupinus albus]|nr:hypothetical protein Lal_00013302 [Lupinus albus]